MDIKKYVANETNTKTTNWDFRDGPDSGHGVDYYLVNLVNRLDVYLCLDQGEVVSFATNPIDESTE